MKMGSLRLVLAGGALVAAVCLAFLIGMTKPEAATPLIAATMLAGMARVGAVLVKQRARLHIERSRGPAAFIPAGGEIA